MISREMVGEHFDYGAITSIVVSRAGEIVREEYVTGDTDSLRDTRSCTKTVLGMLLGIAIAQGLVTGVDVPVLELLGDQSPRGDGKERVTVGDLLTMSSCLDCNDWDEASPGNEERMYPGSATGCSSRSTCLSVATRGFSYCTAGVVAARHRPRTGASASRSPASRDVSSSIRSGSSAPSGSRHRAGRPRRPAACCSTSRSLLALGELYLEHGEASCRATWVHESLTAHARIDGETEYGYLWWLKSFAGDTIVLHDRHGRESRARVPR